MQAASQGDTLLLGGVTDDLYVMDNAYGDTTTEPNATMELTTYRALPKGRAGDFIVRRFYVTVVYSAGFSITISPLVDGIEYVLGKKTVSRPTPSTQTRETYIVAVHKYSNDSFGAGRGKSFGVRGNSVQLKFTANLQSQSGGFYLEAAEVAVVSAHRTSGEGE